MQKRFLTDEGDEVKENGEDGRGGNLLKSSQVMVGVAFIKRKGQVENTITANF